MGLTDAQRAVLLFLRQRAEDGKSFCASDLESLAGWRQGAFSTYKTKHFKDYLEKAGEGRHTVKPRFLRVKEEEYAEIVGQSRKTVARFQRAIFHATLQYEFLLPLTNERKLREALDELFYREPLELRAKEIGRHALEQIIPAKERESDDSYLSRVVDRVGSLLGGYSIGHVSGRFRASPLLGYADAATVLANRGRYLVDETTAVVRFVLPIPESRVAHGTSFALAKEPASGFPPGSVDIARQLFIAFFVESVILGIHCEDEIWFLESGPGGDRLYVLERDTTSGTVPRVANQKSRNANQKSRKKGKDRQLQLPSVGDSLDNWLRQNGYEDVARSIEKIVTTWKSNGVKTRRNWWDVLAGDRTGKPREVAGEAFPIIAAIRSRQGLLPTKDEVQQPGERPPPPKDK